MQGPRGSKPPSWEFMRTREVQAIGHSILLVLLLPEEQPPGQMRAQGQRSLSLGRAGYPLAGPWVPLLMTSVDPGSPSPVPSSGLCSPSAEMKVKQAGVLASPHPIPWRPRGSPGSQDIYGLGEGTPLTLRPGSKTSMLSRPARVAEMAKWCCPVWLGTELAPRPHSSRAGDPQGRSLSLYAGHAL